jgi:hypothetical protein
VLFKLVKDTTIHGARRNLQGTIRNLETSERNETTVFEGALKYGTGVEH